ncbi:hypothetical protein PJP10_32015, partial [Mycobacterium kansasii]
MEPEDKGEAGQVQESETRAREETTVANSVDNGSMVIPSPSPSVMDAIANADVGPADNDFLQGRGASNADT